MLNVFIIFFVFLLKNQEAADVIVGWVSTGTFDIPVLAGVP